MGLLNRFLDRLVIEPNGCWRLDGLALSKEGYAYLSVGTRTESKVLAHRWAYEFWITPVPPELDVDHTCRNRWCVSPDCGDPVTRRVNLLRGDTITARNAAKTVCIRGHDLPPYEPGKKRQCRPCKNLLRRESRAESSDC